MDAIFYNLAKKKNSTKVPASSAGTTFNVLLKQPTSLNSPVLRLSADTFNYNYCQFNGAYYFVQDIVSERNNLWDVHLQKDLLATYRAGILGSSLYVTRSASLWDGYIMDNKYPAKVDYTIEERLISAPWDDYDFTGGTYVCGIVGSDVSNGVGSVTYWAFTRASMRALMSDLLDDISFYNVSLSEISDELQKMLFDPLQYFVSCIWLPFDITKLSGTFYNVTYGWWTLPNVQGKKLSAVTPIHTTSYINGIAHPQTERGSFVNSPPYTRKFLRYLPYGTFEIDPQFFPSNSQLILYQSVDVVTGVGVLRIAKDDGGGNWLSYQTIQAQVGVQIQLSQISRNFGNVQNALTSSVSAIGIGSLAGAAGAIVGAISAIGNAVQAFVPALQSTGINGGLSGIATDITLTHYFLTLTDEDLVNIGRPLCQKVLLSTLSGYCVCETGDIDLQCMDEEREAIVNFLTGGFYIE